MRAYSRGALLGARGNSGVILSQLVGALLRRIGEAGPEDRSAAVFAAGMALATDAAYAAVGKPVEGTILSVARAASEAAAAAAEAPEARLGAVVHAAAQAAREALARTPEQLPVLARAGVVDAGGRGLCVVLDAAESAITGQRATTASPRGGQSALPVPRVPTGDLTEDGPAYEVMYLLETDDDAIPALREDLAPLGDSLVVVGGEGLWNVHIHVDDVGAAVEAGHPGRCRPAHPGHALRRAGGPGAGQALGAPRPQARRRGGRARPGRALRGVRRAGDRGRARPTGRAPDRSSRRSRPPARRRSSSCPTTPTRSAWPRRPRTRPSWPASTSW